MQSRSRRAAAVSGPKSADRCRPQSQIVSTWRREGGGPLFLASPSLPAHLGHLGGFLQTCRDWLGTSRGIMFTDLLQPQLQSAPAVDRPRLWGVGGRRSAIGIAGFGRCGRRPAVGGLRAVASQKIAGRCWAAGLLGCGRSCRPRLDGGEAAGGPGCRRPPTCRPPVLMLQCCNAETQAAFRTFVEAQQQAELATQRLEVALARLESLQVRLHAPPRATRGPTRA